MKRKIFLATHNEGKIERFKKLLSYAGLKVKLLIPRDVGLGHIEVEESGLTLAENAELKARAYFGKVNVPILSNDTGCYVEGEGLIEVPKRVALGNYDEKKMTKSDIASALLEYWKGVARRHGGRANATWQETFVVLHPDGRMIVAESRREVILTDHEFGQGHIQMPVRALYISKVTNKPSLLQTHEEELRELQPVTEALKRVLG